MHGIRRGRYGYTVRVVLTFNLKIFVNVPMYYVNLLFDNNYSILLFNVILTFLWPYTPRLKHLIFDESLIHDKNCSFVTNTVMFIMSFYRYR